MKAIDRAQTRVGLLKDAVDLAARISANEAAHVELLDERAQCCRELRAAGVTNEDLQEIFGISRSRVQQLLRATIS